MSNKNKYIILSTILIQTTIIFIYDLLIMSMGSQNIIERVTPFFNMFMIIPFSLAILAFISMKKLDYYVEREAELKLLKANMENTEELITILNAHKSDYMTHLQSISALIYLEEYEELSKYLEGITKDYNYSKEIIKFGHPALTALINTKREIAREKGIFFYIKVNCEIDDIEISSWDLCSLVSNVLENAIEAVLAEEGKKWVKIIVNYNDGSYVFEIENKGHINDAIINKLFVEPGITTKASTGRGYGLYLAKKIVDRYGGAIDTSNTDYGTVISKVWLPGEVRHVDKKAI